MNTEYRARKKILISTKFVFVRLPLNFQINIIFNIKSEIYACC